MLSVLVVEDEPDLGAMMAQLLEMEGYRPVLATDGVEALAHARAERFDIVLSDLMMPNMDGPSLLRALRDHGVAPACFILMTALPESVARRECPEADAHLMKPFPFDDLLTILATCQQRIATQAAVVPLRRTS